MIDRGSGVPIVLIPGIQGRWEWMAATVDALAERCRVLAFSLADEPTSGTRIDPGLGFDAYVAQVLEVLDDAGVERAVIAGVSFSGLVATEFAARHPERTLGVVLASALPPGWTPDLRARFYIRAPRLLSPLFWLTSPARMLPELVAALGSIGALGFGLSIVRRSLSCPLSPVRMARRAQWLERHSFADLSAVGAPVLVLTGEDGLDRIVKPALTRRYLEAFPRARYVTLAGTGHIGLVTKPREFAAVVCAFANEIAALDDNRISA
jgi:pimeloyl-ACP methyl ester carboxylesterase